MLKVFATPLSVLLLADVSDEIQDAHVHLPTPPSIRSGVSSLQIHLHAAQLNVMPHAEVAPAQETSEAPLS